MKRTTILMIVGVIITMTGMVFHLQGQTVMGPKSSFMYSNPDWITHGIQITVVGIIITILGIIITIIKRN